MGLLIEGKWHTDWYDTKSTGGKFQRTASGFRNWITKDGSPGLTGKGGFKAEPDRYHLYVSLACPWAHRALIFRKLKGLEELITISSVNSFMGDQGWTFKSGNGVIPDSVNHKSRLHEIYTKTSENYTGRVTVPMLWDKHKDTIVSNESSEIIRMFNSAFDDVGAAVGDFYPADKRQEIDAINELIYNNVNNGVYKTGFATTQAAYDEAVTNLFDVLEKLEQVLSGSRYLIGDQITEADWRLFTTLVRFDAVYVGHFKCNKKRIIDFPELSNYVLDLYQYPGISSTVDFEHIKAHYYASHENLNPSLIVPCGPKLDFDQPHNRDRF
ncbi:MAG: glutathione-dependent reductase [Gammaproteobacteria bacterium]|nr:glutathione-dependent reductase [Gammaproteobacteria bacterium]